METYEVQVFWKWGFNTTSTKTIEEIEALKDNPEVLHFRY